MSPHHLILLRHGQTTMSTAGLYASRTDVPLSDAGRSAAKAWSPTLAGLTGFHSPLLRAVETAALAGVRSESMVELSEWEMGDLEGQASESYRSAHPAWNLFRDGAPGGETPQSIRTRAGRALDLVASTDTEVLVLVGHGQFFKSVAMELMQAPLESAARCVWGPGRAALFSWRASLGGYALAGWNRTPSTLEELLERNA